MADSCRMSDARAKDNLHGRLRRDRKALLPSRLGHNAVASRLGGLGSFDADCSGAGAGGLGPGLTGRRGTVDRDVVHRLLADGRPGSVHDVGRRHYNAPERQSNQGSARAEFLSPALTARTRIADRCTSGRLVQWMEGCWSRDTTEGALSAGEPLPSCTGARSNHLTMCGEGRLLPILSKGNQG